MTSLDTLRGRVALAFGLPVRALESLDLTAYELEAVVRFSAGPVTRAELGPLWERSGMARALPGSVRRAARVLLSARIMPHAPAVLRRLRDALRAATAARPVLSYTPLLAGAPGCADGVLRHGPPELAGKPSQSGPGMR
jgi:hypothetical protein